MGTTRGGLLRCLHRLERPVESSDRYSPFNQRAYWCCPPWHNLESLIAPNTGIHAELLECGSDLPRPRSYAHIPSPGPSRRLSRMHSSFLYTQFNQLLYTLSLFVPNLPTTLRSHALNISQTTHFAMSPTTSPRAGILHTRLFTCSTSMHSRQPRVEPVGLRIP